MLNMNKKNYINRIYSRAKNITYFNKIMFVSCVRIDLNKFKLNYLMNCPFVSDESISLMSNTIYIDLERFNIISKYKFGVWLDPKLLNLNSFIYSIYSFNDKLIYKNTRNNTNLNIGCCNSYGHKLIYKAVVTDKYLIEY